MLYLSTHLSQVPFSVFEDMNRRLAALPATEVAPLHQGKTWFAPLDATAQGAAIEIGLARHQHAPPEGVVGLRAMIARHLADRRGMTVDLDRILVTAGATHAVALALRATLSPGEEALVASPQWLFTNGLVAAAVARPVEVPIFAELSVNPDADFIAMLDAAVTPRTRCLYVNIPNNPTGVSLRPGQRAALAQWARRRDLWLIADNAYENYDFSTWGFQDLAQYAPERTFSAYTFSKTYAMPGWRVGFLVYPETVVDTLRKWGLYSVYSISTASQHAAAAALATPPEELERRHLAARSARDFVSRRLKAPHTPIEGGLYAWLDLRKWSGGDVALFIRRCAEAGVGLAPGEAFGACGVGYARLCFTAVPPERLESAIETINGIYFQGGHDD